jgi:hypothetical protein
MTIVGGDQQPDRREFDAIPLHGRAVTGTMGWLCAQYPAPLIDPGRSRPAGAGGLPVILRKLSRPRVTRVIGSLGDTDSPGRGKMPFDVSRHASGRIRSRFRSTSGSRCPTTPPSSTITCTRCRRRTRREPRPPRHAESPGWRAIWWSPRSVCRARRVRTTRAHHGVSTGAR